MLQKTVVSGIYKDESSGALINKDAERLISYKKEKQFRREFEQLKNATCRLVGDIERLDKKIEELASSISKA